jgi:hypothetical protein
MTDAYHTIRDPVDGPRPIRWMDGRGTVHACEAADVHRDIRLVWTLCQRDVPANAARLDHGPVDCPTCTNA